MKRFFTCLLALCLLAGLCCFPAAAQVTDSGSCGDNATWTFDASTGTLTISGTGTAVGIPGDSSKSYGKYRHQILHLVIEEGITAIASPGFCHLSQMQTVQLPDSLTTLGASAFRQCEELTEVYLGPNVTTLGEAAFNSCFSLKKVVLPEGLKTVEMSVFADSGLTDVSIPSTMSELSPGFFRNCDFSKVYIPANITSIGQAAFCYCDQLTDIYYGGTQEQWNAIAINNNSGYNDVLFSATIHLNHNHSFDGGTVTRQATCKQKGIKTYTCTVCNAAKQETFSGSHNWDNGAVTAATCTKDGVTVYTCSLCGEKKSEVITSKGHSWDSGKVTAATCTKDGSKVYTCSDCKETKEETLAATGHSWDSGTQNADTTVSYNCKNCSAIKIEGTPPSSADPAIPTENTTASTETGSPDSSTSPTETQETFAPTEPVADTETPDKDSFPWGIVIGTVAVILASGGTGLWFWLKKKNNK